jgi:hypothetical protein
MTDGAGGTGLLTIDAQTLLAAYAAVTIQEPPKPEAPSANGRRPPAAYGDTVYGLAALAAEAEDLRRIVPGGRNDALNTAAFRLGQLIPHELTEATVERALLEAALAAGLDEGEATRTLRSGLEAGKKEPRYAADSGAQPTNGAGYAAGFAGETPPAFDATPAAELPLIKVNNRQLRDVRADALAALLLANERRPAHPRLFVRGGALTRVVRDENGAYSAQIIGVADLAGLLADCATWIAVTKDDRRSHVTPPGDVTRDVLALGEWPQFPALAGVVNAPTFGAGGELHDEPGYSPHTSLYYADYVAHPEVDAAEGRRLIMEELLGDFPFMDAASKAHAVAMLLLPFVRPMISGPTPLHMVDAPTPGTGKGLLVDVCALPSLGRPLASMTAGKDDDEWRKRLTSTLLRGETHVHIDNITVALDSGVLASALTQEVWEDRLLGQTRTVSLRIRQIWCANGNNLAMSDEIARRTVWIRLDANEERPWERENFRHPNLRTWALKHRPKLIAAALALIRRWIEAGMPAFSGRHKGSYGEWSRVVGGILQANDVEGFLGNEDELYKRKVSTPGAMTEFVTAWKERYGDARVDSGRLFMLASTPDEDSPMTPYEREQWLGLLEDHLSSGGERGRRKSFGRLLSSYTDKVVGGCKIVSCGRSHGKTWWQLLEKKKDNPIEELGL